MLNENTGTQYAIQIITTSTSSNLFEKIIINTFLWYKRPNVHKQIINYPTQHVKIYLISDQPMNQNFMKIIDQ